MQGLVLMLDIFLLFYIHAIIFLHGIIQHDLAHTSKAKTWLGNYSEGKFSAEFA